MVATLAVQSLTSSQLVSVQAINQLDLGPIKVKLMEQEEGEGWSVEQVNMAEKWYKRFLFLCLQYPSVSIVPSKVLDTIWHYHILDTRKYAKDSQDIFGYFLHHFPYFGMRGEADSRDLVVAFTKTKELFLSEFGEPLNNLQKVFPSTNVESSADCDSKSPDCAGGGCGECTTTLANQSRPVFVG
ncbi:MAG: hypothetical protein AAB552_01735 [Patescibacteria group bacterium]